MINNDINDEDYGKEMEQPTKVPIETPQALYVVGMVITACICTIIVSLTIRLDRWLVH